MRSPRYLSKIFVLLTIGALCSSALAKEKVIVAGEEWCPYICGSKSAPGFVIEVLQKIFDRSKEFDFEYREMPWLRNIDQIVSGGNDALILGGPFLEFPYNEESLANPQWCFLTKPDLTWKYEGPKSLENHKLITENGAYYSDEINKYVEENKNNKARSMITAGGNNSPRIFQMLVEKRGDIAIEDINCVSYTEKLDPSFRNQIKSSSCLDPIPSYISFSPKYAKTAVVKKLIDAGLKEMKSNGEFEEILKKYGVKKWWE